MSYQLQLSSRAPRSMNLLFCTKLYLSSEFFRLDLVNFAHFAFNKMLFLCIIIVGTIFESKSGRKDILESSNVDNLALYSINYWRLNIRRSNLQ